MAFSSCSHAGAKYARDPGLATRINSRFAARILVSYTETARMFPAPLRSRIVTTGNPVRQAFFHGDPNAGRALVGCPTGRPLVLVLGGSLGARSINHLIRAVRNQLTRNVFLVHQTGKADAPAEPDPPLTFSRAFFAEELPHLLAAATLVICRAGANTLWELAASGRPSLLIPLPAVQSRGDQIENAALFAGAGASVVLPEEDATPERLLAMVEDLLDNKASLQRMGDAARRLGRENASQKIAEELTAFASPTRRG